MANKAILNVGDTINIVVLNGKNYLQILQAPGDPSEPITYTLLVDDVSQGEVSPDAVDGIIVTANLELDLDNTTIGTSNGKCYKGTTLA